jgi:LysM repeat protein
MPYPTSPARYLAPIALLVAALAIVLVVSSAMSDNQTVSAPPTSTAQVVTHRAKPKHKTYVVKTGDTLSGIAAKTGVSLDTIQTLNTDIDAQALHAGQKVKLAP